MAFVDDSVLNDLVCKVNTLQNQMYSQYGFKTLLPDKLSYTITKEKHKLLQIKGYLVLTPAGEEVEVRITVDGGKNVKIESNISLLNCTIILY